VTAIKEKNIRRDSKRSCFLSCELREESVFFVGKEGFIPLAGETAVSRKKSLR